MLITIYGRDGSPKAELSPNDSSTQVKEIQGDNVLTLSFTLYRHITLDVDDYCDFLGERYWLNERYRPKQKSSVEWAYDLKLYGIESRIRNLLVINRTDGADDPVFPLTAPPREHVAVIVGCMNEGTGTNDWKVGQVDGTENITVDYHGTHCDEGLREIAGKVGAEFWAEGHTVNVCRCEHGESVTLGYDCGLVSIDPGSANNVRFYTRLYPVGSIRNIDPERYGHPRLRLPGGVSHVDVNADRYTRVDHYEADAFAGIYPRRTGTVSSVRSEERTGQDGSPFTVYYFTDSDLPFNPDDCLMPGKVMRVSFQEGSELAGLGNEESGTYYFEVNYDSDTREFEIITAWPYDNGMQLPGGVLVPKPGDRYILWNMRMPDEYYALAEAEFLEAVNRFNEEHCTDIAVFKARTDHVWIEDNDVDLFVGRRVRLESREYFPETGYKDSRITRITRKVNLPSQMDIEIGDALGRSAMQSVSDSISEVRSYARSIAGSLSLPDIIRTGDRTEPTDNNLYSARRSDREFIHRNRRDTVSEVLRFTKGLEAGEYEPGASGGFFGTDPGTGDSFAEVARLYVRVKAFFEELTVVKAGVLAGKQYITPGGGIRCARVEEVTDESGSLTAYRCWFLSGQDGENTECMYSSGDQAISEMFNAVAGTSNKVSNHRYWRLVTAVSNDAYTDGTGNRYGYIDLSATDCEPGSDIPQEGDEICQLGSRIDPSRQTAMVFSTVDADAPSVKLYSGIDSYSLAGRAVVSFGRDPITGRIFFRLGADGDRQYLRYSQDGGLEVAGKISSKSTYDDGSGSDATLGDVINDRIADTDILFISHTSQTVAPALPLLDADGGIALMNGWTTDAPEVQPGRYIWHTTYVLRGDGTAYFTPAVCISGGTGSGLKTGIRPASAEDWTLADLQRFAANDGEEWSVMNATDFNIGDTCVLNLVIKDLDNTPCQYFGVVMDVLTPDGLYPKLSLKDQRFIYGHPGSNYTENLVTGSRSGIGWSGYTRLNDGVFEKDNSSTTENYIFAPDITVEAGKKYTLSFQAKATANLRSADLFLIGVPGFTQNSFSPTTQWRSFSFVNTSPQSRSGAPRFDNNASTDGATATLYIRDLKIEEGENSNPVWTPNSAEMLGMPGANYTENLLTGTRDFTGEWSHLDRGTVTSDTYKGCRVFETTRQWGGTNKPVHLEPGTYTFSAYARVSSQEQVNIYLNDAYNTQPVIGTEWQRVRFVFRVDTAGSYSPRIEKHLATSTVLYMAGYKVEEGDNSGPVWSPAPSEQVGQSAKTVIVNSDATAFMYEDNFNKLTGPNTINLTATLQGTTGYQWSYKTPSMAAFVDMQGMTSATYSLPPTASGWGSDKSMTLRCTSGGVHDEVTIAKVSSGAKGANGSNFTENLLYGSNTSLNGNGRLELFLSKTLGQIGVGKKITVSFDYEYSDVTTGPTFDTYRIGMECHLRADTGGDIWFGVWKVLPMNSSGLSEKGRFSRVLVIPENLSESSLNVEAFAFYIQLAGGECTISNFKVEEGDNPSPVWTPNSAEMLGTDAYTVLLTNESHTFAGDSEKAVASSTDCGIVAYKGATQVAATIGAISGMPSGMTAAVSGNGTASARFTVSVTTALTQRQGTLDVPVTVDGKTFTKKFSWSLSLEGKGAHSIYLKGWQMNNNKHSSRVVMVDGKYVGLDNRRGLRLVTLNRETLKMVTDILYDTYADSPSNHPKLDSLIGQLESLDDSVFVTLTSADAMSLSQELINELSKFGGMIDTVVWQARHAFAFIGYKGLQPGYAQWMIDKTVGTSTSAPAEVSAYVANGMFTTSKTQNGVKSITEEYYLSTSRDTPTGGSWSATRPAWVAGRFYWTRVKITYTDGTTEYKGAICATGEPGRDGQDGEPGRPGADATFSPNLVPSIIYDPNLKGGGSTNAMKWIGVVWGNSESNNLRIDLIGRPIRTAGWYSVYFMARRVSGAGAMRVDINDCGVAVTPSLSTIDSNWRAFSGKVYVNQHIGEYGFIDFENGDGIELSDITVTRGEAVPTSWHPTTPELTGGNDNLLLRSDVEVSNAGYPIASYRIAETLNNNEMLACTIWGDLKGGSTRWGVYNSSGYHALTALYRVADGVYSATVRWVTNTDTKNDTLVVYPMNRTDTSAVSTIRRIKLERGTIPTPWSRSSHDFDFITAAMKQSSSYTGGLILAAHMRLGADDASGTKRIMAGVNGLVNSSDDLALWAGGDMVDADKFPNDPDRAAAAIRHNGTAYFARNVIRMLSDYMMVGDNVRLDKDGLKLMVDGDTSLEITNRDVYTDFQKLASNQTRFSYNTRIGPSIGVESGNSVIVEETYDAVSLGKIEAGTQVVVNIALEGVQDSRNFGNGSVNSPFNQPLTVIVHCRANGVNTTVHQTTMPVHSMTVTHNDDYGRPSWSEHTYRIIGTTTFTASKTGSYEIEITFLKESSAAMLGWFSLEGTMSGTVKLALSNQMTIGRNGLSVIRNNNALAINDSMVVMRSDRFGFALHPTLGPVITLNSGTNWYAAQLSGNQILFNKGVSL
ncbi:interleukin-like EMT inducer domain-containing protein [uncultured Duncaniella sp.]|uniref:interleukin-like EMT inducer domain-containing protein n=1 Tax=uncultured Duncaniella sp. TaxID=2768039 RepID=UPI002670705A|nr:interleukin-like EMT inducer domain-containing protein [uncultured Duncaniella sp.]